LFTLGIRAVEALGVLLVLAVEDRQVLQTLGVVLMEEGPEQIVLMPEAQLRWAV
jgi:hypothetical protein